MRRTVLTVAAVIVLAGGGVALAHHSYAEFLDQPITFEATVERIEFTSPHTLLTVRSADDRVHTIIWNAAFQLQSRGVHPTDLKVGDLIELTGYPSRDPEMRQMAKLRKLRRASDGWTWQNVQGRVTVGTTR
jgi:hypothetical protein